jgi:hypothetical protein
LPKNAVLEKEEKKPNKEIDAKTFLLLTQKGPKGSILDVKPLWDSYFRLNFWITHITPDCVIAKSEIVESRFIKVIKGEKGYTVKDLTKKTT